MEESAGDVVVGPPCPMGPGGSLKAVLEPVDSETAVAVGQEAEVIHQARHEAV